jgi:DNA-binding response OmpR family regulator
MPKVMIVDDDRTTSGLLQTLLELDGYDVIISPNLNNALNKAVEANPDAFLVDFYLSDQNGTSFVRELRATDRFNDVPVIMTSGLDHEEDALAAGANTFLIKPFEPSELIALLRDMLNG